LIVSIISNGRAAATPISAQSMDTSGVALKTRATAGTARTAACAPRDRATADQSAGLDPAPTWNSDNRSLRQLKAWAS
jgi:hypothetical protein